MAEIERKFKCNCKEASIVHNGVSYLVICGKHINGAYCAFPKLNIAAELSGYDDDYSYNKKKLRLAVSDNNEINEETAAALSIVITDIIAYNEKLKTHQYDLLINEHSYQQASLNLYDYGVPNNIYGYISAASIEMELPIYLGAT